MNKTESKKGDNLWRKVSDRNSRTCIFGHHRKKTCLGFVTRFGLKQPAQLPRPDRFLKFLHTER